MLLAGKRLLITGVLTKDSIAFHAALALYYALDPLSRRAARASGVSGR